MGHGINGIYMYIYGTWDTMSYTVVNSMAFWLTYILTCYIFLHWGGENFMINDEQWWFSWWLVMVIDDDWWKFVVVVMFHGGFHTWYTFHHEIWGFCMGILLIMGMKSSLWMGVSTHGGYPNMGWLMRKIRKFTIDAFLRYPPI